MRTKVRTNFSSIAELTISTTLTDDKLTIILCINIELTC